MKPAFTSDNSPYMTTAEAAAYTHRPTAAAFRVWARRRGVVIVDRRVDRRDIEAAMKAGAERKRKAF